MAKYCSNNLVVRSHCKRLILTELVGVRISLPSGKRELELEVLKRMLQVGPLNGLALRRHQPEMFLMCRIILKNSIRLKLIF